MGRFYGERINNEEITIEDVPRLWKAVTEKWLDKNGTNKNKK